MNKREIVQALMDSVQQGDFELAASMLTDDFQYSGSVPKPINKAQWLEMSANLKTAFPDLNYHFKVIGADGDVVRSMTQWTGTHTATLDLTKMDLGLIPATNKPVSAKTARTKVTVRGGKVAVWAVEAIDGAGLAEILGQLGGGVSAN